jgi:FkbM family methyltransferase
MQDDLIYDVGLHRGEDTDFYIKMGFRVVGIEANPELVSAAQKRFSKEIELGQLTLVEGAVAPKSFGDEITFYSNNTFSEWGTIYESWKSKNEMLGYGSSEIRVRRVDVGNLLRSFGVPCFLKIDIEGAGTVALNELNGVNERPQYVSIESEKIKFSYLVAEMNLLKSLGYKKFKIVQQQGISSSRISVENRNGEKLDYVFEYCSSGPFGETAPGPWLTSDEAIKEYRKIFLRYKLFGDYSRIPRRIGIRGLSEKIYRKATRYKGPLPGWFDTHASL